jgi:hypothetical protein
MQSFYVTSSGTANLNFTNDDRSSDSVGVPTPFYKPLKQALPVLRLHAYYSEQSGLTSQSEISNPKVRDEVAIYFKENTSENYNVSYDMQKMKNTLKELPNIFAVCDNINLAIKGFPELQNDKIIPIGFSVNQPGKYIIKASQLDKFIPSVKEFLGNNSHSTFVDNDIHIYLVDMQDKKIQDLTVKPEYDFSMTKEEDMNRFYIKFSIDNSHSSSAIQQFCYTYAFEKNVYINYYSSDNKPGTVSIYTIDGKLVRDKISISNGTSNFQLSVAPGIYLVKVISDNKVYVNKLYIKGN